MKFSIFVTFIVVTAIVGLIVLIPYIFNLMDKSLDDTKARMAEDILPRCKARCSELDLEFYELEDMRGWEFRCWCEKDGYPLWVPIEAEE